MRSPSPDIEILEQRIAPASLLNPRTIRFTDVDGDEVTIAFSKNVFTGTAAAQLAKANEVFKFDLGTVSQETASTQQLRLIDFTKFPAIASLGSTVNGVGITITSKQKAGGDGLVDIGAIKAVGVSLGQVVIDGDLGQIDAGGSGLKIGVAGLTVNSLGKRGTNTQIPVPTPTVDNPAPDLVSTITGELSFLKVLGDVNSARVRVVDGKNSQQQITTAAKLGPLTIMGSLLGRTAVETASDDTGVIECDRDIGAIIIGTDLTEGIVGGGGANSGRITASGKIASVKISGSLLGGAGLSSGTITANNSVGAISIGADLAGGPGDGSGVIRIYGNVTSLTIGDDLVAGAGPGSGFFSAIGAIKSVLVKGDLDGTIANSGPGGAGIFANGLPKVTVNGHLLGGMGGQTASIESGRDLGIVTVLGNIEGGVGNGSGSIIADGSAKSITVKGHLTGGGGNQSGALISGMDAAQPGGMGAVIIAGNVTGGGGSNSGSILSGGALKAVTISSLASATGDALKGGAGELSGAISARGAIGAVKIFGNLQGGGGKLSGAIFSTERLDGDGEFAGDLGTISIAGHFTGGGGEKSGFIHADGALKQLTVGGLQGGTGVGSATVETGSGLFGTGDASSIRITGSFTQADTAPGAGSASLLIGGKLKLLTVGSATSGATIRAGETAGTLSFLSDVTNTTISARGQAIQGSTTDLALAKLDVRGNVTGSSILAGYDLSGTGVNPDAQIGTVTIKNNWTASNLVAGAVVGTDAGFGNEFDVKAPGADDSDIVSKIASVTIGGTVTGSGNAADSFGFVAQFIARAKFGATLHPLDKLANTQVIPVSSGVTIREVAL